VSSRGAQRSEAKLSRGGAEAKLSEEASQLAKASGEEASQLAKASGEAEAAS
jgi:hypothetical protein